MKTHLNIEDDPKDRRIDEIKRLLYIGQESVDICDIKLILGSIAEIIEEYQKEIS